MPTIYTNHAEGIEAVRHLAETERLNGHLFPSHVPPGKAAPRFVGLRDGGLIPPQCRDDELRLPALVKSWFPIVMIAALMVFIGFGAALDHITTPDLSGIPEYNQSP